MEQQRLQQQQQLQMHAQHQAQQYALQQQAQQQMMQNGNTFYNGLQHQMMNVNGSFTTNNNSYNQTLQSVQNAHANVNYYHHQQQQQQQPSHDVMMDGINSNNHNQHANIQFVQQQQQQ